MANPPMIDYLTNAIAEGVRLIVQGNLSLPQQTLVMQLKQNSLKVITAHTALDRPAWMLAVQEWRGTLDNLAGQVPGAGPTSQDLLIEIAKQQLPPIPGIEEVLSLLRSQTDSLLSELSLGPVTISIDTQAIKIGFPSDPTTTLLGFLPPNGLGLALNAGPARGGGHLRFESQPHTRFLGELGMSLGVVAVSAFAVLDVLESGYSLAIILNARFSPGLQLSFGFALTGIGGIIGLNREIDLPALEARFLTGAVVDALFADSPAANAPIVLETLSAILRPKDGSLVVGPTVQISWLQIGSYKFFNFGLGVMIELPGPARVVIIGTGRAEIPGPGVSLLYLRVDLMGMVDVPQKLIAFTAALINSRIIEIFRITGSAAFRLNWGDRPYAIITIGGFYPGFNPEPAVFPPLQRVGMSLDLPLPGLYMRFEAYVAVTPNTFQFGGEIEVGIKVGPVSAGGWFRLHLLIQYEPFHFTAALEGGFEIRVGGHTFGGISVHGNITGPSPIVISAGFEIDILFFEISFDHTFTLGTPDNKPAKTIPNLYEYLRPQLSDPSNLRAEGGEDRLVAFAPNHPTMVAGKAVLSNHGRLVWEQKRAPLNLRIERVDSIELEQPNGAKIHNQFKKDVERDWFSPGTFLNLRTDAEKLNQPQFEQFESGLIIEFNPDFAIAVNHLVQFTEFYRPEHQPGWGDLRPMFPELLDALGSIHTAPAATNLESKFNVVNEQWTTRPGSGQPAASQTAAHLEVRGDTHHAALPMDDVLEIGAIP